MWVGGGFWDADPVAGVGPEIRWQVLGCRSVGGFWAGDPLAGFGLRIRWRVLGGRSVGGFWAADPLAGFGLSGGAGFFLNPPTGRRQN